MARLGDICTISSNNVPILDNRIWLLNLDMVEQQTGSIISYNYVGKDELNGSIIQFDTDNVLYSKLRPNLNKVVIPDRRGFATSEMLPLKPNTSVLCREYLAAYLRSDSFVSWAVSKTAGAKMPRLGTKVLLDKDIPLPSLEEQRRIAALLDKVSGLIAQRRAQLDKLDLLVKTRFMEMFGGDRPTEHLECFSTLITKGASPRWQGIDYEENGTLFITSENVQAGYIDFKKRKYLNNKINEIQPRSILRRNDILINIVGASIGRAAVFESDELANINQAVALVRIDSKKLNLKFLITFLNSSQALELYSAMKKGGARDNLSLKNIADLPIPIIPITLQKQFADYIFKTDKAKLTIQQSLDKLETLKKTLMQQYFE